MSFEEGAAEVRLPKAGAWSLYWTIERNSRGKSTGRPAGIEGEDRAALQVFRPAPRTQEEIDEAVKRMR